MCGPPSPLFGRLGAACPPHRTVGEDHLNAKPDITLTEANLGVLAIKKLARRCVEEPAELASMPPSIRAHRQPTVGLRAQDRPHRLKPKLSAVIGRSTQMEAIRESNAAGLDKDHKTRTRVG